MATHSKLFNGGKYQQGVATLMFSAVLMTALGLAALFVAKVGVSEHRIAANYMHGKQLADLSDIAYITATNELDYKLLEKSATAGVLANYSFAVGGTTNPAILDSTGKQQAKYSVIVSNSASLAGKFNKLLLNVQTTLDDGTSTLLTTIPKRSVSVVVKHYPVLRVPILVASLTAQGAIAVKGTGGITPATTVWNDNLTLVPVGGVAVWSGTSVNIITSGGMMGANVVVGLVDPALTIDFNSDGNINAASMPPDKFFENFFSDDKLAVKARALQIMCAPFCTQGDPAIANITTDITAGAGMGGLVWVDNALKLNGPITIGSSDDPVVLVVNGDLTITDANATIFGVIYVAGKLAMSDGNMWGGILAEGTADVSGGASIVYDNAVIGQGKGSNGKTTIQNSLRIGYYSKLPGSWRDF
ncbi:MAG: hypothetical protein AABY83_05750 [Pseudomonadota bacterium]